MVREPDATTQSTLQDNQLLSKHRVLSFKPQLRLEWRGQDGQNETEQPDHSASLGDSITSSTQIRFSVHTRATVASKMLDASEALGGVGRITFQMSTASLETAAMKRSIELLGTEVVPIVR